MHTRTVIMFDRGDSHILNFLMYACNLAGIDTKADEVKDLPEGARAIRRIKGGSGTLEDVASAGLFIEERCREMFERADKDIVFQDRTLNETFMEGVRASARGAQRYWERFTEAIHEALEELQDA